jgi:hypothetical protein
MRRWFSSGLLGALSAGLAIVGVGGTALAYFTTTGTGETAAGVTQLSASTLSTPTPGSGQVALSWSAVSAPGTGAVTYYVTRDGGAPAGTCPTSASPTGVTSCTDTGVAVGSHTYTVTAVWRSWSATSGAKSANVTIGAATHFTISAATTTPAAGASDNLTITAKDEDETTVTTYAGSHELVFSGASAGPNGNQPTVVNSAGTAINFGSSTALTFTKGVATVSSSKNGLMKIYNAGAASLVATEGSLTTTTPLALTVTPLTASKFTLAATSTTPAAGAADDLTIAAIDTYGNTATSYAGSKNVTFSGASASPNGNTPTVSSATGADVAFGTATTIAFTSGVAAASGGANGTMKLYKGGSASIKATEGSVTTPTALVVTVSPGTATKLVLSAATLTPVANASDNLTTTAQDAFGNTATAYTGSHNITFTGAEASPSGAQPTIADSGGTAINFGSATALTFTSGVAAVGSSKNGLMRLNKAGATSVSATDGAISTASPLAFTVSVGAAKQLGLSGVTVSAGTVSSPCLFTCTITALGNGGTVTAKVAVTDSVGNTVSGLGTGHTVKISATGGAIAGTPLTIASTGPAISTATFTYTAPTSGSFSNTITLATNAGTVYTSATATVSK